MDFDAFWNSLCKRNPQLASGDRTELRTSTLKALVRQAFELGEKQGRDSLSPASHAGKAGGFSDLFKGFGL